MKRGEIKIFQTIQKEKTKSEQLTSKKNGFDNNFQNENSAEVFLKPNQPNIFTSASYETMEERNKTGFNQNGLPEQLKSNIENMSGYGMENVRVHYNSSKPAQLQALAYTQGMDIHIAPGQERHLPHEAWHVVQQMQGRVHPTVQLHNSLINDDLMLEREADIMGEKAVQGKFINRPTIEKPLNRLFIQRKLNTYQHTYVLNIDNNGTITNAPGERIEPSVATFANKLTGKTYKGGHLMKREYGGLDNFQNVVPWSEEVEQEYTSDFENKYEDDLHRNYRNRSCNFNTRIVYGNIINANNHEIKKMGARLKRKKITRATNIDIIEKILNYFPREVSVSIEGFSFEKADSFNFGFGTIKKEAAEERISQFTDTDFNNITNSFRV